MASKQIQIGSTPEDEGSDVCGNTCSGDEGEIAGLPEAKTPAAEKVACGRCRRRKIKCDRTHPCSQCIRAQSQCSYPVTQKRAKRQRVLISSMYESRIEHMSQKIDDLARLMEGLKNPVEAAPLHLGMNRNETYPVQNNRACRLGTTAEHESIDNSLFSHAISATRFVEEAVKAGGGERASSTALELESALNTLQAVVDSQKRRNVANEDALPFPRALPLGTTARDLPVPPIDKVMACLRMAQEHGPVPIPWFGELKSFGDFTLYLLKVCSPGPVTDSELIIAYAGLHWLFADCATMTSEEAGQDLLEQARICQSSLETVLSNLGFHIPTTMDYTLAIYLAALYCFQKGKFSACWTFISKASLQAQALELHSSASMTGSTDEERRRKSCLFWSIYSLERGLSLRLARPSTFQDHHITIPKPDPQPSTSAIIGQSLLDSVDAARIYGLIYDDLFSPRALAQPAGIRIARAHALAVEWQQVSARKSEHLTRWASRYEGMHESAMIDFTRHASKVSDYVVLTAIYGVTPGPGPGPGPGPTPASKSPECTLAARIALQEHTECITLLHNNELQSAQLELWVNGALLLLPFFPFNIVFCNVIEMADPDDLRTLEALVQGMERLSAKPDYAGCAKQLRIFRALYNVAAIYVEHRDKASLAAPARLGGRAGSDGGSKGPNHNTSNMAAPGSSDTLAASGPGMDSLVRGGGLGHGLELLLPVPHVLEGSQAWAGLGGMELDPLGTQFGSWFQESSDVMDFLGES